MKKFVISYSDYMGDEPYMESREANSLKEVLLDLMGCECDEDVDEWFDIPTIAEVPEKTVIKSFMDQNGDGCPFVCIFDVEADRQVI